MRVARHHGQVGAGLEEGRGDEGALAAGDLGSPSLSLSLPLGLSLTKLSLHSRQRLLGVAVEDLVSLRALAEAVEAGGRVQEALVVGHQAGDGAALGGGLAGIFLLVSPDCSAVQSISVDSLNTF